jgi:hypothetical protein
MKLYRLDSTVQARGDLFDLRNPQGRIFDFFILNQGSDKSLQFSKPRAQAQSRIRLQDVLRSDYLNAVIGVPIFSDRARAVLFEAFPDELRFYECVVECQGQELKFFLAKTQLYLPLMDKEKTRYRTLTDGDQIPHEVVYRTDFEREFAIARDIDWPTQLVVSQRFVDVCQRESLQIGFAEPL